MDNKSWISRAAEGAEALGLHAPDGAWERLAWLSDELLRWNQKVNLTAIRDPLAALEKHILDSLAIQTEVAGAATLLDIGAGAGFPGIPLAIALPELRVTLVDSVAKKVGFMKHAIAGLGLAGRVRALQLTAHGHPQEEGLEPADRVVSRALMDLPQWLPLARAYLAPEGRVLAMVSAVEEPSARTIAQSSGLQLCSARQFVLPFSRAGRAVLAFGRV